MLFFQVSLLLGYAFAYASTRLLNLRAQAIAQIAILAVACLFLPITPDAAFKPIDSDNPVGRILLVLVASVGVPYVVLSSTSPLLQRWLAALDGGSDVSRRRPRGALLANFFSVGCCKCRALVLSLFTV
jgi:hypothetical protein